VIYLWGFHAGFRDVLYGNDVSQINVLGYVWHSDKVCLVPIFEIFGVVAKY
jgi:hypothetical protein